MIADEPGIVKILGMRLRANGFQIITAHDGAMAMALAQHEKPDLIVLDIKMSGKNGYSVFRSLKTSANTMSIPIVFYSGLPPELAQEKAAQLGAGTFISKSDETSEILDKITELLKQLESQPVTSSPIYVFELKF